MERISYDAENKEKAAFSIPEVCTSRKDDVLRSRAVRVMWQALTLAAIALSSRLILQGPGTKVADLPNGGLCALPVPTRCAPSITKSFWGF